MPDVLPVRVQDFLHRGKSEMRTLRRTHFAKQGSGNRYNGSVLRALVFYRNHAWHMSVRRDAPLEHEDSS